MEKFAQFTDKESKTDPDLRCSRENSVSDQKNRPLGKQTYRGEWGRLVFFDGKHEDRKNQIGRDEHFDEHALSGIDSLL